MDWFKFMLNPWVYVYWGSLPNPIITRRATLLCNITDLKLCVVYHPSLPVSRKHILCPNPLPIEPTSHNEPELQRSGRNPTGVPDCPVISSQETPIWRTNLWKINCKNRDMFSNYGYIKSIIWNFDLQFNGKWLNVNVLANLSNINGYYFCLTTLV